MKPAGDPIKVYYSSPPPREGFYDTRRNGVKHVATRYWDGERWWGYGIKTEGAQSKHGKASVRAYWSMCPSGTVKLTIRSWSSAKYEPHKTLLSDQANIEYIMYRKQYSPAQVLKYLEGKVMKPVIFSLERLQDEMLTIYGQPTGGPPSDG